MTFISTFSITGCSFVISLLCMESRMFGMLNLIFPFNIACVQILQQTNALPGRAGRGALNGEESGSELEKKPNNNP